MLFIFIFVSGHNRDSEGRQMDSKSGQWFGATVRSSGEDGVVLVSTQKNNIYIFSGKLKNCKTMFPKGLCQKKRSNSLAN
jgi:hypothetical protein